MAEEVEVDQTAALIKFSMSGAERLSVRLQEGGVPGGGFIFYLFFWGGTPKCDFRSKRGWRKSLQSRRMASEPSVAVRASSNSMHHSIYESTSGAIKIHVGGKKKLARS